MENGQFIDDFPIKTSTYKGFSMAMLNNQMVAVWLCDTINIHDTFGWNGCLENTVVFLNSVPLEFAKNPESFESLPVWTIEQQLQY